MSEFLFEKGRASHDDVAAEGSISKGGGKPRLRVAERNQVEIRYLSLDEMLELDHQARVVWTAVCGLDLSLWLSEIKAVERNVGRNKTDPRVLVALWIYATLDGVGSAREITRLCQTHLAYQWLCGGVTVNHHMLSDFRSNHGERWDALLTQIVAALRAENLVTMQRVAQDGMRVRADAGKSSFRRRRSLKECLNEARQQVETLKQLNEESPKDLTKRQRAARERAAEERQRRIEEALKNCEELQQQREKSAKRSGRKVTEARVSTTDPEARTMQFSDGGYRPGYNVQFSTDTPSGVIVGVDVVNAGNDAGQLPPMLKQIQERHETMPEEALVDGGFASKEAIEEADELGCRVYAPLKDEEKQRKAGKDPYARKKGDSEPLAAWRARMGTATAKAIYQLRCQTAEWVNALCRNRGFWRMPVRGLTKCRTVALIYAITHNLLTAVRLRAELNASQ